MAKKKHPIVLSEPVARAAALPRPTFLDEAEMRLFAMTFAGGFLFTTLFIA